MENKELRDRARIENVKFWMIAKTLGIAPGTFTVWMRSELSEERRQRIEAAIDSIIAARG